MIPMITYMVTAITAILSATFIHSLNESVGYIIHMFSSCHLDNVASLCSSQWGCERERCEDCVSFRGNSNYSSHTASQPSNM